MLTESFRQHPRIIIVSTHIIEEMTKTIHKLLIIDRGSICFFDTLKAAEEKACHISEENGKGNSLSLQDFFVQMVGYKGGKN